MNMYSIKEYQYNKEHNIYIQPDYSSLKYKDGSEEYIFESLKKIKDKRVFSDEYFDYIKDWASEYHFSKRRTNLLQIVKELFNNEKKVLEIGSGCGINTRWLGENAGVVHAIEGELTRAKCSKIRCEDLDNVTVFCGDYSKTNFSEKYDIICLIGILEYTPYICSNPNKYVHFCQEQVNRLSNFLSDEGIFLIAIENKIGLKYFSGCPEDHTGELFDGISGYPGKSIITFSQYELKQILSKIFKNVEFFHCFPDYKFTDVMIVDDDSIPNIHNWILKPFFSYNVNREFFFSDLLAIRTLSISKDLLNHSNSFLVIGSKQRNVTSELNFCIKKISNNIGIKSIFHHNISLKKDNTYFVIKEPLLYNGKREVSDGCLDFSLHNSKYIYGENLLFSAMEHFLANKFDVILNLFYNNLLEKYSVNHKDNEGYPLVSGNAIDYTFWNVIKNENLIEIDKKWSLKKNIPADWVIFRSLLYFYPNVVPFILNKNITEFIMGNLSLLFHGISEKRLEKILNNESKFQSLLTRKTHIIDLNNPFFNPIFYSIQQKIKILDNNESQKKWSTLSVNNRSLIDRSYNSQQNNLTHLYYDDGNGFSEFEKISIPSCPNLIHFSFEFNLNLKKFVHGLRWDPIEGHLCDVIIHNISITNSQKMPLLINIEKLQTNGIKKGIHEISFQTTDPWIIIPIQMVDVESIKISGTWFIRPIRDTIQILEEQKIDSI